MTAPAACMAIAPGVLALGGELGLTDLLLGLSGVLAVLWALMKMAQRNNAGRGAPAPGRGLPADIEGAAAAVGPTRPSRRDEPSAQVQADLEELAMEIERLSRRLNAELDHRTGKLEALLRDADQKIAELRRLRGLETQADAASEIASTRDNPVGVPAYPRPGPAAALASSPFAARPAPPAFAPEPDSASTEEAVTRSVYALADAGHDSLEIAKRLRENVGKVELILALRRT